MTRTINGVEYSAVTPEDFSVEYDLFMRSMLESTGVTVCLELKENRAEALLKSLEVSPDTPKLLSGLIKCKDERWTPVLALTTQSLVSLCVKPADKVQLFEWLFEQLNEFFETRSQIIIDFPHIVATGVTGNITQRQPPETRGLRCYGQWDEALRVLAGYNPDILIKQLTWHLRDFLLAYEHFIKREALGEYRHQTSVYASIAPYTKKGQLKPPKIPRVLKGRRPTNG